jgi:hypothetical protein
MDAYSEIPGETITDAELDLSGADCDPIVALGTIPQAGVVHTITANPAHFTGAREFRYLQSDIIDKNRSSNHLQGVQRFGKQILLTAADWTEPIAHLFIADDDGAGNFRVTDVVALDRDRPHAGGFQRLGRLLVIPLEGAKNVDSRLVFLSIRDNGKIGFVGSNNGKALAIERVGDTKAGAAAIAQFADGRLLVGTTFGAAGFLGLFNKRGFLDLYLSRSADVRDGFLPHVRCDFKAARDYQSIHFFRPTREPNGDQLIRVFGFRNTAQDSSNWFKGNNIVDLLELRIAATLLDTWPTGPTPTISKLNQREFKVGREDGNFAAAVGIDVSDTGHLALLCGHHWRRNNAFRFTVFE